MITEFDIDDIQFCDNTAKESVEAKAQVQAIIDAMQARIERLEAGLRRIVNGEYDNARTIDAAEKFARELLRGDK
jgi:hypothetical protein